MKAKMHGAQFELVFQHRIVGCSTVGDFVKASDPAKSLKEVANEQGKRVHGGVLVRVPFLREKQNVSIKKGEEVFRETSSFMDGF